MKKIKCILFDLDGTLVNTGPDLLESLNHTLKINGLDEIKINQIGNLVGGGAGEMIKKAFILNQKKLKKNELPKLIEQFLEFYKENTTEKSTLYPNILDTLKKLEKKQYILGVCTNKKQFLAEKVLEELKIKNFFRLILGSSSKLKLKPESDMLEYCKIKLGLNYNEIVMIGDSKNDIIPARKLNIKSIFVNYGFGKIEKLKPSFIINNAEKILECLEEIN